MKRKQILIEKYIQPSEIKVDGNFVIKSWFDKYGDRHSFMGQPAAIIYNNGKIKTKEWWKKGNRHRRIGLSALIYYNNEKIVSEYWYKNGKLIKII